MCSAALAAFLLERHGDSTRSTTWPRPFPKSVFMIFQMTFAIITPALICGAFADRMKFSALLWFIGLWSIVVYAPIAHWVWGRTASCSRAGVLDFAGGTVVHINAGVAGLVARARARQAPGYGTEHMAPHNLVLSLIGASLLWVGWFGFNAGSAVAANGARRHGDGGDADRHRRCGPGLDVRRVGGCAASRACSASSPAPSPASSPSRRPRASSIRRRADHRRRRRRRLLLGRDQPEDACWATTTALDAFGVHGVGGIVGALLTGVFAAAAIGGDAAKRPDRRQRRAGRDPGLRRRA